MPQRRCGTSWRGRLSLMRAAREITGIDLKKEVGCEKSFFQGKGDLDPIGEGRISHRGFLDVRLRHNAVSSRGRAHRRKWLQILRAHRNYRNKGI